MNFYSKIFNKKEYLIYDNIDMKINDLFLIRDLNTLDECINFLDNSYSSAFSYDKINRICYFKISLNNIKSTCYLNIDNIIHDINECFLTVFKKQVIANGLICPTYINHIDCFTILCRSLNFIIDDITFVIIFSSLNETVQIMNQVYNILYNYKNIQIVTLIFDIDYNHTNKFNYQCAKKFWGLEILNYNNLLVLDSDFEFINNINISNEIYNRGNIIHVTNKYDIMFDLDKSVLDNINQLLNINSIFFPLNLYWFINKELFVHFINYLNSRLNNINYNDYILNESKIYFEIVMYKLFLLNFFQNRLNIIDYTDLSYKYQKYFLFDMNLDCNEINTYNANMAISNYINTDKSKYLIKLHNDR